MSMDPGTSFDLRVMAAVLRQARYGERLAAGLLALAGLVLVAAACGLVEVGRGGGGLLLLSGAAGLAQWYCAARIMLDIELLQLAAECDDGQRAAASLDRSLQRLGLLPPARTGRDWSARWQGMCRWWWRQWGLLGVQALAFAAACLLARGA